MRRSVAPEGAGSLDELEAPDGEHVGADGARIEHPSAQRQHADERGGVGADHGDEGDGEHDDGEGELHVGHPHDDGVGPLADPAREEAHEDADHRGDHHRAHGQRERDTAAVEEPGEDVPAQVVGPEHVGGGSAEAPGRGQSLAEARLDGIVRGQGGGERAGGTTRPRSTPPMNMVRWRRRQSAARASMRAVRHEYRMRGSITV